MRVRKEDGGEHGGYIKLIGLRFPSSLFLLSILLHNIDIYILCQLKT